MKYARMIRSMGPVKFILLFLFIFLPALEFSDGVLAVGDFCAFFLLALLINDIFLANRSFFLGNPHSFFGSYLPPQSNFRLQNIQFKECDSIRYKGSVKIHDLIFTDNKSLAFSNLINRVEKSNIISKNEDPLWITYRMVERKSLQKMMSLIFIIIAFIPSILDDFEVDEHAQSRLLVFGMMIWSMVLLGVSYKSIKREKRLITLVSCQIAIITLLISGLILF